MKKEIRLRKNREFQTVYRRGKNFWNKEFTIFIRPTNKKRARFGVSITKKFGKANKRNLIKRRIKEIIRLNVCDLGLGYEMVILPKKNTLEIDYIELEKSLLRLINCALKKVLN
ncbi:MULTISPECIES: ribonuclease P protein component [Parvimonas]|uniref:Ribonuclease P protein component n=1 Tax=Parvimonas parva TaxID=2769485 RepID=A0ABS1C770_9FIRM|nr:MULTISPECIES: ribonuclease P protein component [Parvimonas]KXB66321.1 ribonuclease P protein component [Parvimonas sp. KA00067]MBK1467749.1 ribonuclease P protein component [Parvimonas parva]